MVVWALTLSVATMVPLHSEPADASAPVVRVELSESLTATPAGLDLGPVPRGVPVGVIVELVNVTGTWVQLQLSLSGAGWIVADACTGQQLAAEAGADTCQVELAVDTSTVGTTSATLEINDLLSGWRSFPVTAEVYGGAPPNDAFAAAQDLSALAIPEYRPGPGGAPLGPASVVGDTRGATLEPGEADGLGTASVWYRYTSTDLAGRLGVVAPPGLSVELLAPSCGATWPPVLDVCPAPGGPGYAWVEPGHTVWLRVTAQEGATGPFTLGLYVAPNVEDAVALAQEPGRAFGSGWLGPVGLEFRGETHGATPDQVGSDDPDSWATFVLNLPGRAQIAVDSMQASGFWTPVPLGVRLYAAPSRDRVASAEALSFVAEGVIASDGFGGPAGYSLLETDVLAPGRYYVAIVERGQPSFYRGYLYLPEGSGGDVDPPVATVGAPADGSVVIEAELPERFEVSCQDDVDPFPTVEITVDGEPTDVLARSDGDHEIAYRCTDQSGNSTTGTVRYRVTAPPAEPRLSIDGPSSAAVGGPADVTVTVAHPGGEGEVPAGFRFAVQALFTATLGPGSPQAGVTCERYDPQVLLCEVAGALAAGDAVTVPFVATSSATEAHEPCRPTSAAGQQTGNGDWSGPVCLLVTVNPGDMADRNQSLEGGRGAMVSIPLVGPYLRFDATATDTPEGSTVSVTVTPRNPGTATLTGPGLMVYGYAPRGAALGFQGADTPPGWTCGPVDWTVVCTAPDVTIDAGEAGEPLVLRFRAPAPGDPTGCPNSLNPLPSPPPDPCGGYDLFWRTSRSSILTGTVAYRILPPLSDGPCVLVDTPTVALGDVPVGESAEAPVSVRSCSADPVRLAVGVSDATRSGSADTWFVSSSTTPPSGAFLWTVATNGWAASAPIGSVPTVVGPTLAAGATRVDLHRIRLGSTGPGLGEPFTATVTYTALEP